MAPTLADAVRWPLDADEIRLRLTDRTVARLPAVTRRVWRTAREQPAGSRLRRWLLNRVLTSGWAALDRKDWDLLEAFYDPDVVVVTGEGIPLDWGTTHGWAETRTRFDQFYEVAFSNWRPSEALDLGGPFVAVRVDGTVTGLSTGIALSQKLTYVYEIGNEGRVVRQWGSSNPGEIEAWLAEGGATSSRSSIEPG